MTKIVIIVLGIVQIIQSIILLISLKMQKDREERVGYLIKIVNNLYGLSNSRDILSLCSLKATYKLLEDKNIFTEEDFIKYKDYQEEFYDSLSGQSSEEKECNNINN